MKHHYTGKKFLGLLMALMFTSCGGEAVPPADTAQIVGLIQQDARAIAENPNVTNDMALIDMEGRTNNDPNRGGIFDNADTNGGMKPMEAPAPMAEAPAKPMTFVEPPMMVMDEAPNKMARMAPPAPMQARRPAPVAMAATSIKVGNDRNGQRVSPRRTQKITAVIKTGKAVYADITLYAVPAGSPRPLMNANTLIGFAKNFDTAGGQVQFTRYWNSSTTQGAFLRPGNYNIYFTYTLKDINSRVLSSGGRYWGGNTPMSVRVE